MCGKFQEFSFARLFEKKTMNTENIPGMCVLTNHMRDLVTAENEWVSGHRIELVLNCFEKPEG